MARQEFEPIEVREPFVYRITIAEIGEPFLLNNGRMAVFIKAKDGAGLGVCEDWIAVPIEHAVDPKKANSYQKKTFKGLQPGDVIEQINYHWSRQISGPGKMGALPRYQSASETTVRVIKEER